MKNRKESIAWLVVVILALNAGMSCRAQLTTQFQQDAYLKGFFPKHTISFVLGAENGMIRDEMFSPLNYRSNGGTLGLGYSGSTRYGDLISVDLELRTLDLETPVSDQFLSAQFQLNMEAAFLRKIATDQIRGREFFIGVDFHSNTNLIAYEDEYTLSSSDSYVSHRGLGVQALSRNRFKKNTVSVQFSLPVLGMIYRSPYNLFNKEQEGEQLLSYVFSNGKFGTVNQYFNPSASASISRPLWGIFHVMAGYEFSYLRSTVNKSVTDYQGRLILATTINF